MYLLVDNVSVDTLMIILEPHLRKCLVRLGKNRKLLEGEKKMLQSIVPTGQGPRGSRNLGNGYGPERRLLEDPVLA